MNRKAQGLPLEFIVLAAIAILILVIVVVIVVGGGMSVTKSVSPVIMRQNCESACAKLQTTASQQLSTTPVTLQPTDLFCVKQDIQGSAPANCTGIGVNCYITYSDGVQKQFRC